MSAMPITTTGVDVSAPRFSPVAGISMSRPDIAATPISACCVI